MITPASIIKATGKKDADVDAYEGAFLGALLRRLGALELCAGVFRWCGGVASIRRITFSARSAVSFSV
jgi:hypothetical protein